MASNPWKYHSRPFDGPGRLKEKVVKGTPFAFEARSLLVGTPGSATMTDVDGVTLTDVPLKEGYNPVEGIVQIELGGTADNIWVIV